MAKRKKASKRMTLAQLDTLIERKRRTSPEFRESFDKRHQEHELARTIHAMRVHLGLSQVEVAKRMSTTQQVVSRMEKAGHVVSFNTFLNLLRAIHWVAEIKMRPAEPGEEAGILPFIAAEAMKREEVRREA